MEDSAYFRDYFLETGDLHAGNRTPLDGYSDYVNDTYSDYYDMGNYSYDEVQPMADNQPTEVTLQIVLAFLISILNILVLLVIITDSTLRTSPKYIQVASLALADLIYACAALPLLAEFNIRDKWVHFCELQIFVNLYDTSFHPAFTWFALAMLNIVILFNICTTLFDKRASRPCIALTLALIPWAMTSAGFIPLYRSVIEPLRVRHHPCMYSISPQSHVALLLLTYPLTCIFLVLTSFLTIVMVIIRRNVSICGGRFPSRGDNRVPRGDTESERTEYMCDVLLASILAVILSFPVYAFQMYYKIKNGEYNCVSKSECDTYILGSWIAHLVRLARGAIIPLVWFLGKDFRYAFTQLMKCWKTKGVYV